MGYLDLIAEELHGIVAAGFKDVIDRTAAGEESDTLLRRFDAQYDKMGLEDLMQVQSLVGHAPKEIVPCKVCDIIARKESERYEV